MRVFAIAAVTFNPFTSPATPKLTQTQSSFPSPLKLTTPENQQLSWNHLSLTHCNSDQLAKNWLEYQGINNWEGLLDPLDDILRSEILRYGHFVEAAYRACDFDASSPSFGSCKFSKNSLLTRACTRETGYKPTKNLRATCGIQLPAWVDRGPTWVSTRSSWIGYVAMCQDKDEIARLGRRDVTIAFRGTATWLEWLENLRATLTDVGGRGGGAMVESGFLSLYTSGSATCTSLQQMVREEIGRVLEMYGDEPLSLTLTGHSLGAALAILAAYDINTSFNNAPPVTVISFGGPRVGNHSFRCELEQSGTKILRIVNSDDLITRVPGFVINNNNNNTTVNAAGLPSWVQRRVEDAQLVYADVGQELKLSSRECPHLSKGGMTTCHELSTYLELVNGFVSSNCPFRTTAKCQ
ncbi:hypothetical protein V6N11_047436 [Hibiscus sabdariffa]|uniref:Fungal lipase-type domain-containing protein n=1 Tax=Hibiscus sabdariffa TaxID=183260 RepID=A0ABR2A498_9ROSI